MTDKGSPRIIEFDIRGQICPSSLITTLKELNSLKQEMRDGRTIVSIMTDNRDATVTIPETANNMGYQVNAEREKDYYRITIQKTRKNPDSK